jgi:HPt (histidine-containing phosphotransfer) domain-containing protein
MQENHYEYLNLEILNEQSDGEPEFLIDIINTFLETVPANLEKLKAAAGSENKEEVKFYAHKLKGSFSFIGCGQLGETLAGIEDEKIELTTHSPEMIRVVDVSTKIIDELGQLKATTQIP